jgi:hypothetical protein
VRVESVINLYSHRKSGDRVPLPDLQTIQDSL